MVVATEFDDNCFCRNLKTSMIEKKKYAFIKLQGYHYPSKLTRISMELVKIDAPPIPLSKGRHLPSIVFENKPGFSTEWHLPFQVSHEVSQREDSSLLHLSIRHHGLRICSLVSVKRHLLLSDTTVASWLGFAPCWQPLQSEYL